MADAAGHSNFKTIVPVYAMNYTLINSNFLLFRCTIKGNELVGWERVRTCPGGRVPCLGHGPSINAPINDGQMEERQRAIEQSRFGGLHFSFRKTMLQSKTNPEDQFSHENIRFTVRETPSMPAPGSPIDWR